MTTPLSEVPKVRLPHLAAAKAAGEKLTMLTAYDRPTAEIFDLAGIDLLLVGDSMGNAVLGMDNTLPVTLDQMVSATAAVAVGARRAMIVADLPFGTYETGPKQAFRSAARLIKAGANAVKFEGGARVAPQIQHLSQHGIPVMAHLGFTPQSINTLGGNRIQAKDDASAEVLLRDALSVQQAGAFAVVLELMPAQVAARVTAALEIPTIGIGAGAETDGQVLVWTDMAGLDDQAPTFVQRFGDLRAALLQATQAYAAAVRQGTYPDPEHSF
ncbi:MAG: 3-methyl-2-oxobutanoate hydroxymethyltransferase [Bifidobacteriaceae bacterium]|jgi:3-methyl-2-oxobutanoate hydroxymethyltransferase|nr:3-methyl-2-oxobutanoate hydroxymethyltransferase [Bifidobacteriaceae bacterium]